MYAGDQLAALLIPTPSFEVGEREGTRALRSALRRVKHVEASKRTVPELLGVLTAAQHVESLRLERPTSSMFDLHPKAREKRKELEAAVRDLDGLRRLYLGYASTHVVLGAFRGQPKPLWPLVELQMATTLEPDEVEFFEAFASTLRKLDLKNSRDEDDPPSTLPLFRFPFPLLTHLTIDDFLLALLASTCDLPSLRSLRISFTLEHHPLFNSIFTVQLPLLLRRFPSLRYLFLDINEGTYQDDSTCFDPTVSSFLLDLCAKHDVELVSPRLFLAFGEDRQDVRWMDHEGTIRADDRDLHVSAKASAIEELGKRLVGVAGRARATQDGQVVAELQDLLLPLYQWLLVETAEDGMVRPGE